MALSGAELLEALADGTAFQRKLRDVTGHVIPGAMQQAREHLAAFWSRLTCACPFDIFTDAWPAKTMQTIDGIDAALESKLKAEETHHLVNLAQQLGPLKPCEVAVSRLIEGRPVAGHRPMAHHDRCVMPELVNHGLWLDEGRHVLLGVGPDPVTYGLGAAADKAISNRWPSSPAPILAARRRCWSAWRTLAFWATWVCRSRSKGANWKVEALHILAKAGVHKAALEQTLVELATVVSDPTPKLILADELEAITEPGAGARIIAGMLLAAEAQPDTTMLLVNPPRPGHSRGHRARRFAS